jgi:hypothetical protein
MNADNYVIEVLKLAARVKPGTVLEVEVLHDDWCGFYSGAGGRCDCNVELIAKNHTGKDEAR